MCRVVYLYLKDLPDNVRQQVLEVMMTDGRREEKLNGLKYILNLPYLYEFNLLLTFRGLKEFKSKFLDHGDAELGLYCMDRAENCVLELIVCDEVQGE